MLRSAFAAAAAFVIGFGALPSLAQEQSGLTCDGFSVDTRVETIRFLDSDPVGISLGDTRVGRSGLFDSEGTRIGATYFHSAVIPSEDPKHDVVLATVMHQFQNGMISATVLAPLEDATDVSRSAIDTTVQAINGGTGVFTNVQGTVTVVAKDADTRTITFDIHCD